MALKDDRVEQCLRSCGSEFQMWGPKQKKHESHDSCVCIAGLSTCGCQKKSAVYETECRHAAVQRGKQDHVVFLLQVSTAGLSDSVTVYRTAVEREG